MKKSEIAWFDVQDFVSVRADAKVAEVLEGLERGPLEWVLVGDLSEATSRGVQALRIGELSGFLDDPEESILSALTRRKPGYLSLVVDATSEYESLWRGARLPNLDGVRLLELGTDGRSLRIGELRFDHRTSWTVESGDRKNEITARDGAQDVGKRVKGDRDRGGSPAKPPVRRRSRTLRRVRDDARMAAEVEPSGGGTLPSTLSAGSPKRVGVGKSGFVDFRIAIGIDADPLASATLADLVLDQQITVVLSIHGGTLQVVGPAHVQVDVPFAGQPTTGKFAILGTNPGRAKVAVIFSQGGSQLGAILLQLEVDQGRDASGQQEGTSVPSARDVGDDHVADLLIDEVIAAGELKYRYRLSWPQHGLWQAEFWSAPLKDREGAPALSTRKFVDGVYEQLTESVVRSTEGIAKFDTGVAAIGTMMGRGLFPRELHEVLLSKRNDLRALRITAFEPYVPWELVRFVDRDDHGDDRTLAEYGLVRAHSGLAAKRSLPLRDWVVLQGEFAGTGAKPVGSEVQYLAARLGKSGITPKSLGAQYVALLDAVRQGDFDALHIACHGETNQARAERASLLLAALKGVDGQEEIQTFDSTTMREEARLKTRRPLVFLNACESGRQGPVLTSWGGWPNAFLEAGAGTFIGTAWPVRDVPAGKFARKFYDELLSGKALVEATRAARTAARQAGDASWLAFKVYGDPSATIAG